MNIRKATEQDRVHIAQIFAQAFYKDWVLLSKDTDTIASGILSGLNLEHYLVAEDEQVILGFLAYVEKDQRAFHINLKKFQKAFGFLKCYMAGMAMRKEFQENLCLPNDTMYIDIVGVAPSAQETVLRVHCLRIS